MAVQSERITILGTPDFKAFLTKEAKKKGVSVSEFVRQRCRQEATSSDQELLAALIDEISKATTNAKKSLERGLKDAEKVLAEVRRAA